jgi:hypothetical protein
MIKPQQPARPISVTGNTRFLSVTMFMFVFLVLASCVILLFLLLLLLLCPSSSPLSFFFFFFVTLPAGSLLLLLPTSCRMGHSTGHKWEHVSIRIDIINVFIPHTNKARQQQPMACLCAFRDGERHDVVSHGLPRMRVCPEFLVCYM